jgi:hypothetical protein
MSRWSDVLVFGWKNCWTTPVFVPVCSPAWWIGWRHSAAVVASLESAERRTNAQQCVQGLLSNLDGKDIESIAYLHDRERQGLQKFIGQSKAGVPNELGFKTRHELMLEMLDEH